MRMVLYLQESKSSKDIDPKEAKKVVLIDWLERERNLKLMKYFRIMWISFACKSSIPLKKKDVKKQLPSNLISLA